MSKSLPLIVQSIVYRNNEGNVEFLVLKRSKEKGEFWSIINGTLEINETIIECRNRELNEETGITKTLKWTDEINRFSFTYNDYTVVVLAFAVEIDKDKKVIINDEHTDYKWLNFKDTLKILKYDDEKNGIKICYKLLNKK